MRGCLQKANVRPRPGALKGEHTWRIILPLGRGPDGKHKQKWVTFHGTRKQAEQELTKLTGEVDRGEFVSPTKQTFGTWLNEWLEKGVKPPMATASTYRTYRLAVENHIKPSLGNVPIQQLTPMRIQRYQAELAVKMSPRTVRIHHAVLTGALDAAVSANLIRVNVARRRECRAPKVPRMSGADRLQNVWSPDEASKFMAAVKNSGSAQDTALFRLALDAGLRKGELLGLQWKDINDSCLHVRRQLMDVVDEGGAFKLDTSLPKSKSTREVHLADETVALLREHKRQQSELKMKNRLHYVDLDLVFAQEWADQRTKHARLGLPLSRAAMSLRIKKLCIESGIKRISPHGLRHTCATILMLAGEPAVVVQERLGHADAALTLNIYTHVLPGMQQAAAKRAAALIQG
jgi:integrase